MTLQRNKIIRYSILYFKLLAIKLLNRNNMYYRAGVFNYIFSYLKEFITYTKVFHFYTLVANRHYNVNIRL